MRIALFGVTGGTGHAVLREGLERGHEFVAIMRSPQKLGSCDWSRGTCWTRQAGENTSTVWTP
ncbi:MAG: hypothetical protein KF867_03575 [Cryobacterium sp.]|nr:hypothetical protein [Cryobacterium sp.]